MDCALAEIAIVPSIMAPSMSAVAVSVSESFFIKCPRPRLVKLPNPSKKSKAALQRGDKTLRHNAQPLGRFRPRVVGAIPPCAVTRIDRCAVAQTRRCLGSGEGV